MPTYEEVNAYITRYALTNGRIERRMVKVCRVTGFVSGYAKNDWHRDYESALARVEQMRAKKIASLQKQIAQLESLAFTTHI